MRILSLAIIMAASPVMTAAQRPTTPPLADPPRAVQQLGSATATLVLMPRLDVTDARVIVLRRGRVTPRNLVLVTAQTTASDLTKAMAVLAASRRRHGDVLRLRMRTVVRATPDSGTRRSPDYPRAQRDLVRLRDAVPVPVDGIGTFPALTVGLAAVPPLDARPREP